MSSVKQSQPVQDGARSGDTLTRAWVSVALMPVFLLGSVILTLFLYELFGYKPENADAPLWVDSVIGLLAIAMCLVPCAAAVWYGRRSNVVGDRRGLIPMAVGAIAGLSVTVLTVVSTLGPF